MDRVCLRLQRFKKGRQFYHFFFVLQWVSFLALFPFDLVFLSAFSSFGESPSHVYFSMSKIIFHSHF